MHTLQREEDNMKIEKSFPSMKFANLMKATYDRLVELSTLKGGEYSGDDDRLLNFRRNGVDLDLPMETVLRVYAAKHWDAIGQYIRDMQTGKNRQRLESIEGRVDDLLVYLLLFKAMLQEREEAQHSSRIPHIPANLPTNIPIYEDKQ